MSLSYRTQVIRLRELAELALPLFPLKNPHLEFIHHGENTTYRVEAGKKRYLLRLHRYGYHTKAAILEELSWLRRMPKEFQSPRPMKSKKGRLLELVKSRRIPEGRYCDLFEWVHGTFARKNVGAQTIYALGALLGKLQKTNSGYQVRHRRYWSAEGLLGKNGRFGSIDRLAGVTPAQQQLITASRKKLLRELRAFERRFPERLGYIHADLHFGNFVIGKGGLGAIDFDDSGYGFHAYDLAVPLTQLENICGKDRKRFLRLQETLQQGYSTEVRWDQHDRRILPKLKLARRLLMLGWLCSRSDNPDLKKILPGAVKRTLKHLRRGGYL